MKLVLKSSLRPRSLLEPIERGLRNGLEYAVGVIQTQYLTGPRPQKLGVRSGHLRSSIRARTERRGTKVHGFIGSYGVPYARIHEFGGIIRPRRAKALRFKVGGHWVTVKKVVMPKRPYLHPGVKRALGEIRRQIVHAVASKGVISG